MSAAGRGLGLVVSGGQTGVDRAALDAAIEVGLPYGGWCPKGGLAEDFGCPPGLLAAYPELREAPSADPAQRTEWNLRDSDATLVIRPAAGSPSPGTDLTVRLAAATGRSLLVLDPDSPGVIAAAIEFIDGLHNGSRLNIAGPRESEAPGIYSRSRTIIEAAVSQRGG